MDYQTRLDELDDALALAAQRRDHCGMHTPEGAAFAEEAARIGQQIQRMQRNQHELRTAALRHDAAESQRDKQIRRTEERAREWIRGCAGFAVVGVLILLVCLGFHVSTPTPYLVAVFLLAIAAGMFALSGRARRQVAALETADAEHAGHTDMHRAQLVSADTQVLDGPVIPEQQPRLRSAD